jgi:hypothetical protein
MFINVILRLKREPDKYRINDIDRHNIMSIESIFKQEPIKAIL